MNDVSDDISALMPPGELTGPSVWYGRDYQGSDDWVHHLSGAEIAEVESAIGKLTDDEKTDIEAKFGQWFKSNGYSLSIGLRYLDQIASKFYKI